MAARARQQRPKLLQLAAINSFMDHPRPDREWSFQRKIEEIAKAGFDGVTGRTPPVTRKMVEESGLLFWCTADITCNDDIRSALGAAQEAGAVQVNVQLGNHDTPTRQAVALTRRTLKTADDMGIDAAIEVHRDTATETPEKAYALADGFEKAEGRLMPIVWDFSHPAVIKHLKPPYAGRLLDRPELVQNSKWFHLRAFNGHHAQVPVVDSRGNATPEFEDWIDFVDDLFKLWLAGAPAGSIMWTCPEMIASGYRLSVFSDNWRQARFIKDEVDKVWRRRIRNWSAVKAGSRRRRRTRS